MKKSVSTEPKSSRLSPSAKGVLLIIGAYFVTIWIVIFIIAFAIMIFIDTTNCGTVSRAIPMLWITIAVVFLASILVVRSVARKIMPSSTGRLAIMVTYGTALLASYVFIAFGLLVAFNC